MAETAEKKPLGTFRGEVLQAEIRKAAHTGNDVAVGVAYANAARAIMREYPGLQRWERDMHLGCLQHEIELLKVRTHKDCSHVLPELARILNARFDRKET